MRFKPQPLTQIARLNRQRDEDLARLATGWTPTPEDLAGAPTLSHWVAYTPAGQTQPFLMGHLKGHARQLDGWTTTEPVLAQGDGWVRLHHTWLRLGPPMPPRPAPRPVEEPAPEPVNPAYDPLDYVQPGPWGR